MAISNNLLQAEDISHSRLIVEKVWSRASSGANGVVYMTIFNHGFHMDRLLSIETSIARKAELHTHLMKDGVMMMRRISAVEVDIGELAVLEPGGNHIMLIGLKAPLKEGHFFPLHLYFEKAGTITVNAKIGKVGAMMHDEHGVNSDHSHDHRHGS